jgi:hypothetical protein
MSLYDDLVKTISGFSLEDTCREFITVSMRPWDANIDDVIDNWKTTGFYTVEQLKQINLLVTDLRVASQQAISAASKQLQLPSHHEILFKAHEDINDELYDPRRFIEAQLEAERKGIDIIEAQGLKRFIVNVLKSARVAKLATSFVECSRPGALLGALQALGGAAEALISFAKAVGNVVKQVGQTVLKIPDLLGSFFKFLGYLPWFVVAFGGYYVATKTILPPKYDPLKLRERETFAPWRKQGES